MVTWRVPASSRGARACRRRSVQGGGTSAHKTCVAQERNRLLGRLLGKQQSGVRGGDDTMVGEPGQFRFGYADGTVVRQPERTDRDAKPNRYASGDRTGRLRAFPALDAIAQHGQALADHERTAWQACHAARYRTAAQRRPQAYDMTCNQVRRALERLQRHQAAEAVADKVDFSTFPAAYVLHEPLHADIRRAGDACVVERFDAVAGALQAMTQHGEREAAHPQAVQEYDQFTHADRAGLVAA